MSKRKRGGGKPSSRVPPTDVVDRVEEQAAALALRRKQRLATVETLQADRRTPLRVIEAAAQSAALADEAFHQAVDRYSLQDRIACREGCAWCCYSQVGVSAPEVLRIAEYLRTALSPDDLAATSQRLAALDEKVRGMSNLQRAEVALPCALLVNDRCSVYSVRPIACRKCHSTDASVCERSFKETTNSLSIPMFYSVFERVGHVQDGLLAGLSEAGLKADLHELTTALRIALETPDAAERWLRGDKVFPTIMPRGFAEAR
jgi:Fe-S-cluster containining protein